jgi:hypothetical protein
MSRSRNADPHRARMPTEPLTPEQVEQLLRPDPRTAAADLFVLRDALLRMSDAFERLARSAEQLQVSARALERLARSAATTAPERQARG